MAPETDIAAAAEHRRQFYVSRKIEKRWSRVSDSVFDLQDAMEFALLYEDAAVFMTTDSGGFIYWSSKNPSIYNSSIISEPLRNA